jgi:cellulose synthase/poly-beta-1,6-N-acetylglucosamine synthase-like glycosyltransferase
MPGWLQPMWSALKEAGAAARVGVVGNVQHRVADGALDHAGVHLTPHAQFQHTQALPGMAMMGVAPGAGVGVGLGVGSDAGSDAGLEGAAPVLRTLAVTGACMLVRRADFEAVGGFDSRYVNGCEDYDLCFKLQAANKKVYLASDSRIHHHVSLSRKTNTLQDLRNSRLLFSRWRGKIKNELSRIWHDLLSAGPDAYADWWPESIEPEYLSTPHALSRVMAETMLRREEAHWQQMLDGGLHPMAAAP